VFTKASPLNLPGPFIGKSGRLDFTGSFLTFSSYFFVLVGQESEMFIIEVWNLKLSI
jgi:hypothetical protein